MLHGLSDTPESMVGNGILNDGACTQYVVWNAIANGDVKECIVVYPCVCCNEEGKAVLTQMQKQPLIMTTSLMT